jgi:CHAD domain-containing protein
MASEHESGGSTETEIKYDAPADGDLDLPPLDTLPQVASVSCPADEQLAAEYFDTPGLVLIKSGITLRRRRGGHDAGWHLKLPLGPHTRREIQRPLGRSGRAIPDELASLVRARTRGEELLLVARVNTRRRRIILNGSKGEPLAEIAIDDVSAQVPGDPAAATSWREVEVELIGGDTGLLAAADRVLRGSGLQPAGRSAKLERALGLESGSQRRNRPDLSAAPAAEVIGAYLSTHLEALVTGDSRLRAGEPDAVHEMRVATRRLRSTIQSFGFLLKPEAARLGSELKWLGDVLGAARDAEVLAGHLRANLRELPAEQVIGPVHARIQRHFASVSGQAGEVVMQALDSARYFALLGSLEELARQPAPDATAAGTTDVVLRDAVRRGFRKVSRRMRRASRVRPGPARDTALHQARKAAKRARYAAEAVAPATGRDGMRFARQMKKVQSVLGAHQDSVIARQAARQLGISAHLAGENAFSYGLIYQRDDDQAGQLQDQARKVWRRASRPRYRRWVR